MVKNAASCKNTENNKAIYGYGDRSDLGIILRDTNDRTLYILLIDGEAPTRLKVFLANRCNLPR